MVWVQCLVFRVWGLGFGVQGLELRVCVSGFKVLCSRFRVWGLGLWVWGSGFRIKGLEFGVKVGFRV